MLYLASIWVIPIIVAITFHEAAHGFVAYLLGDETAWRLGRVSFNPLKHIDPDARLPVSLLHALTGDFRYFGLCRSFTTQKVAGAPPISGKGNFNSFTPTSIIRH